MSMESDHLSAEMIQRYRRKSLSPVELLQFDDHLGACESCRQQVARTTDVLAVHAAVASPPAEPRHLSYEELAGYVNDTLAGPERREVQAHIDGCRACRNETRELAADRARFLAAAPDAPAPDRADEKRPAWLSGLFAGMLRPAVFIPAQVVTAIAAVAVVFVLQVQPLRRGLASKDGLIAEREAQLARATDDRDRVAELVEQERRRSAALEERLKNRGPAFRVLSDGTTKTILSPDGTVLRPAPADDPVGTVMASGQLELPAELRGLVAAGGGPRSRGKRFAITAPVQTMVNTVNPVITWSPVDGASHYEVRLRDLTDDQDVDLGSSQARDTQYSIPVPLNRGHSYSFTVTARQDGTDEIVAISPTQEDPAARFRVMTTTEADRLADALKVAGGSLLAQAVAYAKAGVRDEAERRFAELARQNPDVPELRKFAESLRVKPPDTPAKG